MSENNNTIAVQDSVHRQSPLDIWALAFGCCIGWGCFVMPGTTFLPIAGPIGTLIAMVLSGCIMLVISMNYHYMVNQFPDNGGSFTFAKKVFGYDHGFLCAWFLRIAYVALIWANATAFVLIFRSLFGNVLEFGFHYNIAGYDIYFGEVLTTMALLLIFCIAAINSGRGIRLMHNTLAIILLLGAVVCFVAAFVKSNPSECIKVIAGSKTSTIGILSIVALAPWAFMGFEAVSNLAGEYRFAYRKIFKLMALAIIAAGLCYILMTNLAVFRKPSQFSTSEDYIASIGSLEGIANIPTFFVMDSVMGRLGTALLGVTVIAALGTSLLGFYRVTGRLSCALAEDGVLPPWFSKKNRLGNPGNAMLYIMLISMISPFMGRTAVGWFTDITSIGAAIAYGYTSAATYVTAKKDGNRLYSTMGIIGLVASVIFMVFLLVPNQMSAATMSSEAFLILAVWGVLGVVYFHFVFDKDHKSRFGKSTVVWMVLIFMIFFSSLMWMQESIHEDAEMVIERISRFHRNELQSRGYKMLPSFDKMETEHLEIQMEAIRHSMMWHSLVQMFLIMLALIIMVRIYSVIRSRERRMSLAKIKAEERNKAKSAFLFNMSHDLRTPMNAIIGYTELAKRKGIGEEQMREYLKKIDSSSQHLLTLINDVLEMSRIETGKLELDPETINLIAAMDEVREMFTVQMEQKSIAFTVDTSGVTDKWVLCDKKRLDSILLNLLSNAYKFTPDGGSIAVRLTQTGSTEKNGLYELRVKDSGIGMSKEFAEKVFDAFERELSSTVSGIQGTGLGMAITKRIVDIMGGNIAVNTEQGKGTEFVIDFGLPVTEPEDDADEALQAEADDASLLDIAATRLLIVEDNEINREIAVLILEDIGFQVDTAENGREAVDKVAASTPGTYAAILMDIQMPVMNGYEATAAIRSLKDKSLAHIPIIAMTANAFQEDIQNAKNADMDGHIAKPINIDKMMQTLRTVLTDKRGKFAQTT